MKRTIETLPENTRCVLFSSRIEISLKLYFYFLILLIQSTLHKDTIYACMNEKATVTREEIFISLFSFSFSSTSAARTLISLEEEEEK